MRVLFIARRFSYLKNFEGPILELARRGHHLHLVALSGEGKLEGTAMVERWTERESSITFERLPPPPNDDVKFGLSSRISMMLDYLRYLEPAYGGAAGLLERARRRTPSGFLRLLDSAPLRLQASRAALKSILQRLEAATPRRPERDAFLRAQAPDAVLFTPLISLQSEEQDLLTASAEQGLRTVFCVLSWDNLSSKAVLRTIPDLVTVWNDVQRDEARTLHGVPDDRIAVTGAQTFDHWFGRGPSRSRADFLTRVGLPPDRPFLLWVCSALFRTSPIEARFVRRWIEAIRASSDPLLREASILVRPHPTRMPEWAKVPLHDIEGVSLWGANPVDLESRNDYFDSLYYSQAVAGLNTSAFLEAAIVGRPVYAPVLTEFHDSQEGTLHFKYLLDVSGGLLHTARDLDAHLADLARALHEPAAMAERSRRFVEAFVRPRGLDVNATGQFVATIERLMATPRRRFVSTGPTAGVLAKRLYRWLESHCREGRLKEWLTSPHEIEHVANREAKVALVRAAQERKQLKAQRLAERRQERQQQQDQRLKVLAEREAAKAAREEERTERLRLKALKRQPTSKDARAEEEVPQ